MNNPPDQYVPSLAVWLIFATKDLYAPARERIKLEIEAHYAEAVAAHMAAGLTPDDAEGAALLELGDPMTAAKDFRKRHLNQEEAERLSSMEASYRRLSYTASWWWAGISVSVVAVLFFLVLKLGGGTQEFRFFFFFYLAIGSGYLVSVLDPVVQFRLLKKPGTTGEIWRRLLTYQAASNAGSNFFAVAMLSAAVQSPWLLLFWLLPDPRIVKTTRLWLKLRYSQTDSDSGVKA